MQKLTGDRAQAVTREMRAPHRWSSPHFLAAQLLLREIGGLKPLQVHSGGITNSLSVEVSTGEGNGTPLLTVAWKAPWTEEPGGLQPKESLGVGHNWATSLSLSCTGEGNGNPLQCSCLENPRDGGAWWAAVYGVTQRWTRLKRLSNSSRGLYCSFSLISVFSRGRKRGGGSARAHRNTRFTYYMVGQRLEPLPSKLGHMLQRQGPSGLPHCHPRRGAASLCVGGTGLL